MKAPPRLVTRQPWLFVLLFRYHNASQNPRTCYKQTQLFKAKIANNVSHANQKCQIYGWWLKKSQGQPRKGSFWNPVNNGIFAISTGQPDFWTINSMPSKLNPTTKSKTLHWNPPSHHPPTNPITSLGSKWGQRHLDFKAKIKKRLGWQSLRIHVDMVCLPIYYIWRGGVLRVLLGFCRGLMRMEEMTQKSISQIGGENGDSHHGRIRKTSD